MFEVTKPKNMYSPDISEAEYQQAKYEKDYGSHVKVRRRMQMICLYYQGYGPGQCAEIIGVHCNCITNWIKLYIAGGLSALRMLCYDPPKSELVAHQEELKSVFRADPPFTVGQARQKILELTNIERSLTQVRHFLKKTLGWGVRKLSPLPGGKLSIEELAEQQAQFLQNQLIPLLQKAVAGKSETFFVDAVHPVQGFHTARVWCESKLYQRTSSGRDRINILGDLNTSSAPPTPKLRNKNPNSLITQ